MMIKFIGCQIIKITLFLFLIYIISSCRKPLSFEESHEKFLNSYPHSKEFKQGLQGMANHLYHKKWPDKYYFTKPKIRHEKMIVEWEHKNKSKTIRKDSNLRCNSNIERLGLSCLIAQLGPVNIEKLMKSNEYLVFVKNLKLFLSEKEWNEETFKTTISAKNEILELFSISETQAKKNETTYKSGIILTSGFYMGMPFFKRITLDSNIETREEYLRVYLHECGHQLFDYDRKFGKTLKLGLSWIGWTKSTHSWWVVEEKSCNLIADEILEDYKDELKSDKRYQEILTKFPWVYHPLSPDFKEKYSRIFFNSVAMLAQFKNARIDSRYSTKDEIAKVFREKLKAENVKIYIHLINKYITLKEVLTVLNAAHLDGNEK